MEQPEQLKPQVSSELVVCVPMEWGIVDSGMDYVLMLPGSVMKSDNAVERTAARASGLVVWELMRFVEGKSGLVV